MKNLQSSVLFIVEVSLFLSCNIMAQIIDTVWTKRFDVDGDQIGWKTKEITNNDLIVLSTDGHSLPTILKLDCNGNLLWKVTDSTLPNCIDFEYTSDGSIILLGSTKPNRSSDSNFCCITKYDESMNMVWRKIYNSRSKDLGSKIKQTRDHGYIIAGISGNDNKGLFWVKKIDESGITEWETRFGDTSSTILAYNGLFDIIELPHGDGYSAVGYVDGPYNQKGYYVHLDIYGNILDEVKIDSSEAFESIVMVSDSTFIIGGRRPTNLGVRELGPCYFLTNKKGNFLWSGKLSYFKDQWLYITSGCKITNEYILLGGEYNINKKDYIYVLQTNNIGDSLGSFRISDNNSNRVINIQSISNNEAIMNYRYCPFSTSSTDDDVAIAKLKINYPPFFESGKENVFDSCIEDQPYHFQLYASDSFPGDFVKYHLLDYKMMGMHVNDTSGDFIWTPLTEADSGNHAIKFVCFDRLDQKDTLELNLYVRAINDPPVITTILPDTFNINVQYSINLSANDEEKDSISWFAAKKPSGLVIDSNKLFWKPELPGIYTLILIASDGKSADTLTSIIQVSGIVEALKNTDECAPLSISISSNRLQDQKSLIIGLPLGINNAILRIYDLSGKTIERRNHLNEGWHQIKLHPQLPGIFIVKISADRKTFQKTIINTVH